jgi:hypothetical protein
MIGHDAPGVELIGGGMSGEQTFPKQLRTLRASQQAFSFSSIEQGVKALGMFAVVELPVGLREIFGGGCAAFGKPSVSFGSPFIPDSEVKQQF